MDSCAETSVEACYSKKKALRDRRDDKMVRVARERLWKELRQCEKLEKRSTLSMRKYEDCVVGDFCSRKRVLVVVGKVRVGVIRQRVNVGQIQDWRGVMGSCQIDLELQMTQDYYQRRTRLITRTRPVLKPLESPNLYGKIAALRIPRFFLVCRRVTVVFRASCFGFVTGKKLLRGCQAALSSLMDVRVCGRTSSEFARRQ